MLGILNYFNINKAQLMINNIIFDFDGVIADSEFLVAKAFSKYLKSIHIVFSEKEFSIYAGKKTYQVIDDLCEKFNINDKDKFFINIMSIAKDIYSKDLNAVEGVRNFLENNDKKIFIGSNSIKERILLGLRKIHLENYFSPDTIFSADLVKNPKPHPDIYIEAIKKHNLDINETIIIEDSAVGVMSGVAAGIKVIGLTAGKHWHEGRSNQELIDSGALYVINSYGQLKDKLISL